MTIRLVDHDWGRELTSALARDNSSLHIICPFIKARATERLMEAGAPDPLKVITRFNLGDFSNGVSDVSALRLLLDHGAQIRGVKRLHAKVYLPGTGCAIVTSANLTEAALTKNHEFGVVATDVEAISECRTYFDSLWSVAGEDLRGDQLDSWEQEVTTHLASGARAPAGSGLPDYGTEATGEPEGVTRGQRGSSEPLPDWISESDQGYVKFFGQGHNRAPRSMTVLDEVQRSGSHWACPWPRSKRPRSIRDGAVMFLGRMVEDPNDIAIYGRAVGMRHVPGRDDATADDIEVRPWKEIWPNYVRVHHAEFVAGSLANGVSLNELMADLGSASFAPTQRNATQGEGNQDPRRAYMRKPGIELTDTGLNWLNGRLEAAFLRHGKVSDADLSGLDWPDRVLFDG